MNNRIKGKEHFNNTYHLETLDRLFNGKIFHLPQAPANLQSTGVNRGIFVKGGPKCTHRQGSNLNNHTNMD